MEFHACMQGRLGTIAVWYLFSDTLDLFKLRGIEAFPHYLCAAQGDK